MMAKKTKPPGKLREFHDNHTRCLNVKLNELLVLTNQGLKSANHFMTLANFSLNNQKVPQPFDDVKDVLDNLAISGQIFDQVMIDWNQAKEAERGVEPLLDRMEDAMNYRDAFRDQHVTEHHRPLTPETIAIRAATDKALSKDPSLHGVALRDAVFDTLDDETPAGCMIPNDKIGDTIRHYLKTNKVPSEE